MLPRVDVDNGGRLFGRRFIGSLAGLAVALAVVGCGSGGPRHVTKKRGVTIPPTSSTSDTSVTSATSTTGVTSAAAALSADQAAERLARDAAGAAVTYGTNNNGNYSGMTAATLHSLTASVQVGPGDGNPYLDPGGGVTILDSGAGFTVTATSSTGDTFNVGESATGTPTQSCTGTASTACQNGTC
jgi:hypothetical protein